MRKIFHCYCSVYLIPRILPSVRSSFAAKKNNSTFPCSGGEHLGRPAMLAEKTTAGGPSRSTKAVT